MTATERARTGESPKAIESMLLKLKGPREQLHTRPANR